jgi:glutamate N-acetyltransferase / amino-acid N-acetyltransferase
MTARTRKPRWMPVDGGVTAAREFLASGVSSGIKKQGLDVAVVFSSRPASAAAVFTTNCVQAAPVTLSREHLRAARGRARAVLLNSGCANACTGVAGMRDASRAADRLASLLGVPVCEVIVASTGVIGERLPAGKIEASLPTAVSALSPNGGAEAMRAIMTTDTREKHCAVEGKLGGVAVRIGGMAKGSGMIHPQLATMLAVVTTDAGIPAGPLGRILRRVCDRTFNCVTIDGDTSTNDMVAVLANGAAGPFDRSHYGRFEDGLEVVCAHLARSIARDGEGATKLVEVIVSGAPSFAAARKAATSIAQSPLVKTAINGEQLNWGRILCAAGYSGIAFDTARITLAVCDFPVFRRGAPVHANHERAEQALKAQDVQIMLDLGRGIHSARVWTCDFSREYININASYLS